MSARVSYNSDLDPLGGRVDSILSEGWGEVATRKTQDICCDAVAEFEQTEQTYRASLHVLIEAYLNPFMNKVEDPELKEALSVYYGYVLNIVSCHALLAEKVKEPRASIASLQDLSASSSLASLPDGRNSSRPVRFPALLLEMVPSFNTYYTTYIRHYERSSETIRRAKEVMEEQGTKVDDPKGPTQLLVSLMRTADPSLQSVDLSLTALLTVPLKRLTNYGMLTQEWISQLLKRGETVPSDVLEGQRALSRLLSSVDKCKQLLQAKARLKEIERRYGIIEASRDHEVVLEGQFTRATRGNASGSVVGPATWKLRPAFVLVTERGVYIAKLTAEEGSTRAVLSFPTASIRAVGKVRRGRTPEFGDQAGVLIEWLDVASEIRSAQKRRSGREGTPLDASLSASEAGDSLVETVRCETRTVSLLCHDELEANAWVQTLSQLVNRISLTEESPDSPLLGSGGCL